MGGALVTRNHVLMVFDTLFALDAGGNVQYQMLAGHTVDADQKVWTLTLRNGLLFHDNTPVLACSSALPPLRQSPLKRSMYGRIWSRER
jgi:ABC-type transport system substrate-binding protein